VLALLEAQASDDGPKRREESHRYRSVARCVSPEERTGHARVWGVWTQLYSLRSDGGFGVGHLGDLRRLIRWAGDRGAAFVGLNPLHDLRHRGHDVSPYSPITRLYRNPLYLDVTAVPEWRECADARRAFEAGASGEERRRLLHRDWIDYESADRLRRDVVSHLWQTFRDDHRARADERGRAFEQFVKREGRSLRDYATFRAIERKRADEGLSVDWRQWPASLRNRERGALEEFRMQHADDVDALMWEQFELDRQLAEVAEDARSAGLGLGLYQDLALGCDPSGFDTWAFPSHFVDGVSLGAPPDDYSRHGQDWGLPPLHPWRLGEMEFGFFRQILRASLRHAGMLRIDHVLGLRRQWWIPTGRPSGEGVYVRFPASALLSIIAEESRRAEAVVVGEDLGTVPRGFQSLLARYGAFSCRVLLFEREAGGRFRRASSYSPRALSTAHTHDQPPLAGWWSERDLDLRSDLGVLEGEELEEARRERHHSRDALIKRLRRSGSLGAAASVDDPVERCAAIHRFLSSTPSALVGLSLDDLAGEREPVNIPGLPTSVYPAWQRRMSRTLDDLLSDPDVDRALGDAPSSRGGR
jgi:4-alpha-glucanotransferase